MAEITIVTPQQTKAETFPWGSITWMISGPLGTSETMTFGKVVIKAGESNPYHTHTNCDEILYLLSGSLEHTMGSGKEIMRAGDTISIPKGIPHNATALGDTDAVMVVAYSSAFREMKKEE